MSVALLLVFAFGAGLATFASPCFLPVVPVFVTYIAGQNGANSKKARLEAAGHALIFMATFALMFVIFSGIVGAIGQVASQYRQLVRIGAGIVVVVMGLHTGGFITIAFLDRIFRPALNLDASQKPTWRRSVFLGIALGAGWTPCVGPMVVAVIATATAIGSLAWNIVALILFSMGFGLPFVMLAVGSRWFAGRLNWFKKHPLVIHRCAGIVLVITGLLLIADLFQKIGAWIPNFA